MDAYEAEMRRLGAAGAERGIYLPMASPIPPPPNYGNGAYEKGLTELEALEEEDAVRSPPHYRSDRGYEAIDVIEGFALGYRLGNVVKYVLRAERKGERLRDLKKARWYLDREIKMAGG